MKTISILEATNICTMKCWASGGVWAVSGKAAGAAGAACKQLLPLQAGLARQQKKKILHIYNVASALCASGDASPH